MSPPQAPKLSWLPNWPPNWPEIQSSIDACYQSGDWGRYHGQWTERLKERLQNLTGTAHCHLCCSGSAGVELALKAVGVGTAARSTTNTAPAVAAKPGVALCGYDYPGNFRAVELAGGRPVLVDAAPDSYSLCPNELSKIAPEQIKAVLVSHLFGVPAAIESIRQVCDQRGWKLIEDACQTPGMRIGSRSAGAWGDIGVLSFGGSKPLTAGNGGALVFQDPTFQSRLASQIDRPSNAFPLSQLQAAALLPQLDRLNECDQIRSSTGQWLIETLGELIGLHGLRPITTLCAPESATIYKLALQCDWQQELLRAFSDSGLPVGDGYRSMHRSSDRRCDKVGDLARCQELEKTILVLDHSALLVENTDTFSKVLFETLGAERPENRD